MRAVDTNILVRLIARDDERQAAAAERYIRDGAWASSLAVAETVWVLKTYYRRSAEQLIRALEILLQHRHLVLQDSEAVAAALALFRSKPSLGFSDCLILELARRAGHLPLGTFDRALGKVDGAQRLSA